MPTLIWRAFTSSQKDLEPLAWWLVGQKGLEHRETVNSRSHVNPKSVTVISTLMLFGYEASAESFGKLSFNIEVCYVWSIQKDHELTYPPYEKISCTAPILLVAWRKESNVLSLLWPNSL